MATVNRYVCDVCNLKLVSEKAMEEHMKGKKHQRVEELIKMRKAQAKKSIFVGNLVKGMSEIEITDYFMNVGSVERVIMDKEKHQYAIVEFQSEQVVEEALANKKHTIRGRKVSVKQREWKPISTKTKIPSKKKNVKINESEEALIASMKEMDSVTGQMMTLLESLQLAEDDVSLRYLICRLLESVLQEFMPYASIALYGSSVNSYGVQGCDLDLNLTIDGRDLVYEFNTPATKEQFHGKVKKTEPEELNEFEMIDKDDEAATMEFICKIIKQLVPGMKHVRAIPLARKPVVKFSHSESGLHCDISINNRLALRNTELLAFYGKMDPAVRPLVFAIRHWAKVKQIAGNIGAGPKLTNYALTLLVITYLQMEEVKVLPSMQHLHTANDAIECIIDGWNCSFSSDVTKLNSTNTHISLEKLLIGFFKFYATLDFSACVICPQKGKVLFLETFQDASKHNKEFKIGVLNIQDPLELSHNVTSNVNDKTVKKLTGEMKVAQVVCQSKKFSKHDSKSWGLMVLLKEGASEPLKAEIVGCLEVAFHHCSFTNEFKKKWEGDKCGAFNDWVNQILLLYKVVLKDVLKFHCDVIANETDITNCPGTSGSGDKLQSVEETDAQIPHATKRHHEEDSFLPTKKIKIDHNEDPSDSLVSNEEDNSFTSSGYNDDHAMEMEMQSTTSSVISLPGQHLLTYSCKTTRPMWIGRRKLRRVLMKSPEYKTDLIALESAVTSRVIKEQELMDDVKFKSGSMHIQLQMRKVAEDDEGKLIIKMIPVTEEVECKNFFHFFENFSSKLLADHKFN